MVLTAEQITEEARGLQADRLVESLNPAEEGNSRELWVAEANRRQDDVRSGRVKTIPYDEAMARVKRAVSK